MGIISDTHDLLRPEALRILHRCETIIHAGDFCSEWVLEELQRIAPVIAVRGNGDKGIWAEKLPAFAEFAIGPYTGLAIHDISRLPITAQDLTYKILIYGHSHTPSIRRTGGRLSFNPGSAGPRRFSLPVTVGTLTLTGDGELIPEITTIA